MSDKNGTTAIWQDPNSGLRRHKLMTKELGETIPAIERDLWEPRTIGEIRRESSKSAA